MPCKRYISCGGALGGPRGPEAARSAPHLGHIFVHNLSTGTTVQLSGSGTGTNQNPNVAPSGNVVVWELCPISLAQCGVMAAVFKPDQNAWSVFALVPPPPAGSLGGNPDTDDTWIVYDADRAGNATGRDIYFQPVAGGPETQLAIAGSQSNPSISQGSAQGVGRPPGRADGAAGGSVANLAGDPG